MKLLRHIVLVTMCMMATTVPCLAANVDERADKRIYDRLIREIQQVYGNYNQLCSEAVAEARKNNGAASMETKARMLGLRDELDRKRLKILMISLRHNWKSPSFADGSSNAVVSIPDEKEEVFTPADRLIHEALAREAIKIASDVRLPVITISISTTDKEKNDG